MVDVSVLITARNEMFLKKTIECVLEAKRANTEIIVISDGGYPLEPIDDHPDVTLVIHNESVGQRAGINEAARLARGKYIMKLDAHCALDEGFDVKLMADCEPNWIVIPRLYNLHAFDWVCEKCGNRWYQSPTPKHCYADYNARKKNDSCDSTSFKREVMWQPRWNRKTDFMRFDKDLKFQYWGAFEHRKEGKPDIAPTMSCLGACWFLERKFYWEIDGLDEAHGSWGQMGTELACKAWLSGGAMMANKKTWYSHMFRTQGGDFGFPYKLSHGDVKAARKRSQDMWRNGKWPKAKHDLDWLIEKFRPIPDWHDEKEIKAPLNGDKGIIFYTDNKLPLSIAGRVQKNLMKASGKLPIVSVSLKPMGFPYDKGENITLNDERGWITMNKQILAGLKKLKTKYVFFCEHDVLYHPSHFYFTPTSNEIYYYNINVWRTRYSDGYSVKVDDCKQLSGMVCNRELAIKHYEKRLKMLESGTSVRRIGFEPGTHNRAERVDDLKAESYLSQSPNIDIRGEHTATKSRWSPDEYRNKKYTKGWTTKNFNEIEDWKSYKLNKEWQT